MSFLKRNINGILGTILFHLVIIIIAMAFSIKSAVEYKETYMLIDPQYLEEMEQDKEITDDESEMSDIDIENYMQELRNVGSNFNQQYSQEELQAMSQEEIKQMYEEQMLKEKYGDDYEEMMNSTYEDYLNQENNSDSENNSSESSNTSSSNNDYAGPALVYVELENPDRGKAYIDVPVFTCRNGGTVVIKISIDSDGRVKSASVQSVSSTGDGTCISNSARQAALQSRFTTIAGGKTEYGTITYQFIQQ
ncbi:MAG: hypothetical protein C0596_17295 [Marinilabiliales bacterium]|nr:MAG: hypothetical protein C0596_17295 [Marinilabiliales bacterium]